MIKHRFVIMSSVFFTMRSTDVASDSSFYSLLVTHPEQFHQKIEPFFLLLALIIRVFSNNEYILYFVISLIINLCLIISFYKIDKKYYPIYMGIYSVSFVYLNSNINILRQGIAIAFLFYAIVSYFKSDKKQFWIFSLLAVLEHSSSFIVILMLLIGDKLKLSYKRIGVYLILYIAIYDFVDTVAVIGMFSGVHWTIDRLYWYLSWNKLAPFEYKHIYYLLILLLLIYIGLLKKLEETDVAFLKFFLTLFVVILVFKRDEFTVDRIAYYYFPIITVMIFRLKYYLPDRLSKYYPLFIGLSSGIWIVKSYSQFYSWWVLGNIR